MTRRKSNRINKKKAARMQTIHKDTREQRGSTKTIATPSIQTVKRIVEALKPWELSASNRFKTYQMMLNNSSVAAATDARITAIEAAQSRYKLRYDKNSPRSIWLKDFIEYNLAAMGTTTRQVGRDCAEMVYNGIALNEVSTRLEKEYEDFVGNFVIDKITYIDPLTLDSTTPFTTTEGAREVSVWRQRADAFTYISKMGTTGIAQMTSLGQGGVREIDARKVGRVSYSASSSRIMGTSVFDSIYTDWREMSLIQDFLLMGIQKDLAGTPVLRVPVDLFDQAKDPNSDAAATMSQLTQYMKNLHAGDEAFMILPSDAFNEAGSGALQYDVKFLGIDGNNKNFNLVEIIEQKKKNIFLAMGVTHLISGENGGGSYNLHEGKATVAAHYAERDNDIIDEMWNKHIIPLILRLNGFKEKISDIPVYEHGAVQPVSLEEKGKYLNRVLRAVPCVPDVVNAIMTDLGIEYRVPENYTPEQIREMLFEFSEPSKVGSGNGSSGSGDTQAGGASSDTNAENAA